jgi:hypothetical protein
VLSELSEPTKGRLARRHQRERREPVHPSVGAAR